MALLQELGDLLTTEQAARILAISPNTLKWWRVRRYRSGPDFIRLGRGGGRIRYSQQALMAYLRKQTISCKEQTEGLGNGCFPKADS